MCIRDSFYSGNPKNPKSSIIYPTKWNGTDSDGNALADGKYQYVLTYSSKVPGAAAVSYTHLGLGRALFSLSPKNKKEIKKERAKFVLSRC